VIAIFIGSVIFCPRVPARSGPSRLLPRDATLGKARVTA
jgi:hypothetical protein